MFKRIRIEKWRQFDSLDIELDSPMTVITGANGSGKTTILNILSRHFGWNLNWTSTRATRKSDSKFWSDVWELWDATFVPKTNTAKIGEIQYTSGRICELSVPLSVDEQYQIYYQNQESVPGLYIPSHTQPFTYQKVETIPTDPKTSAQQFQEYQNLLIQLYQTARAQNPGLVIKSSIISLAVFGYGNEAVAENPEFRRIFEAFQETLKNLLPVEVGFERIEIRMPDVVLITRTGNFSLGAVSGGLAALIGIAWQILMYGIDKEEFVVIFDEPENHLHPAMQRELLPNLEKAFPKTQFIISTHSPFVVTSNPNAKIYVLRFDQNKVRSRHLAEHELSGDYNETLQEILDVPLTIPKWVEKALKETYDRTMKTGVTESSLEEFKRELRKLKLYPQFVKIAGKLEDIDA
jgi:predicted ATP-binding protein involved in virulence